MPKKLARTRRPMRGDGIFGDIWDGIKSIARNGKIFSTIARQVPVVGGVLGDVTHNLTGYGRKRKRAGMRGRGAVKKVIKA
jgi:hypothetical protein